MLSICKNYNNTLCIVVKKGTQIMTAVVSEKDLIEFFNTPSNLLYLRLVGNLATFYDILRTVENSIVTLEFMEAPYDYRILECTMPCKVIVKRRVLIEEFTSKDIRQLSKASSIVVKCATASPTNIRRLSQTGKLLELSTHNIALGVNLRKFHIKITRLNAVRVLKGMSFITCKILVITLILPINEDLFIDILNNIPSSVRHVTIDQADFYDIAHLADIKCDDIRIL